MSSRSLSRAARHLLRHARTALDAYSIRASLGLAFSLLLMVGLTRAPVYQTPGVVGWGPGDSQERIHLTELTTEAPEQSAETQYQSSDAPVTVQEAAQAAVPDPAPEPTRETPPAETPSEQNATLSAAQLTALGPAGQRPQVMGGMGSFYLSIEYPEEARRRGIQGRVVLDFIVDTEGYTKDVRVLKSLHPLCDSSAVAALERTRFVPGKRDGEAIPVRMRLPVRFQLVNLAAKNNAPQDDQQDNRPQPKNTP